jgi:hypothetical protein
MYEINRNYGQHPSYQTNYFLSLFFDVLPSQSPLGTFRRAYSDPIAQYLAWRDGFGVLTDLNCFDALTPAAQATAATELLAALRGHRRCPRPARPALRRSPASAAQLYPAQLSRALRTGGHCQDKPSRPLSAHRSHPIARQNSQRVSTRGLANWPARVFHAATDWAGYSASPFLLAHFAFLMRPYTLDTLRRLYGSETQEEAHNVERCQDDEIFGLIANEGFFYQFWQGAAAVAGRAARRYPGRLLASRQVTYLLPCVCAPASPAPGGRCHPAAG